jgi:hypothetical protein
VPSQFGLGGLKSHPEFASHRNHRNKPRVTWQFVVAGSLSKEVWSARPGSDVSHSEVSIANEAGMKLEMVLSLGSLRVCGKRRFLRLWGLLVCW